jgi:hypothetical protein
LQSIAKRTTHQPEEKVSAFSRSQHHQQPRFISDVAIEKRYGIPAKTLRNWRLLGKGPEFRKFGRSVKYDVRLLEAWIAKQPSGGEGVHSSALTRHR